MNANWPTAVVDTNVVVSAILYPASVSSSALRRLTGDHTLLASAATLDELRTVLTRSKFDSRLSFQSRMRACSDYEQAVTAREAAVTIRACRDPRDDKFLELAVSGKASLILSGDADLLALHPFRGIAILTPAAYLASLPAE